ncbi:MAG: hypothetical protein KDA96_09170 [Planctomycetaceae bacterium]|nr:hypothetical protein [Planctomycetaceae bacterium]
MSDKNKSQEPVAPIARRLAVAALLACGCLFTFRATNVVATATPVAVSAIDKSLAAEASIREMPTAAEFRLVTRNIEDIQVGDLVLSRDEHGTTIAPRRVTEVYQRTSHHLRHLTFRDNNGREQTLSTTDEHPFWSVNDNAFVDAGKLEIGSTVTSEDGSQQYLVSSTRAEHLNGVDVFNFQVEDFHTYFVSATTDHEVLLVHNAQEKYDLDDLDENFGYMEWNRGKRPDRLKSADALRKHNNETNDIYDMLNLDEAQRRQMHLEMERRNLDMTLLEIKELAEDMFGK